MPLGPGLALWSLWVYTWTLLPRQVYITPPTWRPLLGVAPGTAPGGPGDPRRSQVHLQPRSVGTAGTPHTTASQNETVVA